MQSSCAPHTLFLLPCIFSRNFPTLLYFFFLAQPSPCLLQYLPLPLFHLFLPPNTAKHTSALEGLCNVTPHVFSDLP
ncbi:hypothetical protein BDZ91DRAFT_388461 [Kalaharituber pfeilii]|nr:hypothetical protein BDZ91DRAFT_388461 [Kalaharituber pfeilii]